MTGLYQPATTEWGEDVEIRPCNNEGCKESLYYQDGGFKEFSTGQKHVCKFYKRQSSSSGSSTSTNTRTGSPTSNTNQAQNNANSPSSSNNEDRLVQLLEIQNAILAQQSEHLTTLIQNGNRHTALLDTLGNITDASRMLINRLLESQKYFEQLLEIRYKELRKDDPDAVYTEEQLAEMANEKRGLPNDI